jgi:HEAT repeat protein
MTASSRARTTIFVSYSHKDREHLERLRVHLAPYLEDGEIEGWLWDDSRILTGSKWFDEIRQALESADAAILLVDSDFLASRFIRQHELPPLLEAAERRGVLIMPVILAPCGFAQIKALAQFQAANKPSQTLLDMPGKRQKERWWYEVARNIHKALEARRTQHASAPGSKDQADAGDETTVRAGLVPAQENILPAGASPSVTRQRHSEAPMGRDEPPIYNAGPTQGQNIAHTQHITQHFHSSTPTNGNTPSTDTHLSLESFMVKYREHLNNDPEIAQLQILGMQRPLNVADIYVKVRVSQQARPHPEREIKKEELPRDPLAIMQQQELWLERRASEAIDPALALKRYHRCAIVGDPGAGKTTLLKRLALHAINHELTGLPELPVYVRLHEAARARSEDLLEFATAQWERTYGLPGEQTAWLLAERAEAGSVLFLLDALDETVIGEDAASAEESHRRIERAVLHLTKRFPRAPIVVTARREGYRQRGPLTGFTTLETLDFLPEQCEQFIMRWFEHYGDERRHGLAAGLTAALKKNPRMATLAANPLLLSLIVLAYEQNDQQLPDNRARLYQQCIDTLLTRWDADSTRRIQRLRAFGSDDQKQLLPRIAWHFHSRGLRYFPESQIIPIIADFLTMRGLDGGQARAVLQAISGDDGLLREQADGAYGFLHLTLQEYFAAQDVDDISALLHHLGDPWWEEVILLYAGQARHATLLLEPLLTSGEIPEDIFHSKLILAGRCLAARPTLYNVQLWQEIPGHLFQLLLDTEYELTRRHAAEALAEIGRAYPERDINAGLLALLKDTECKISIRICIADALRDYGLRDLAPHLLEILITRGARADSELHSSLRETITILADRRLLPRLLQLIFDNRSNSLVLISVADIIGSVGDAETARLLLPLLTDTERNQYVRSVLAYTIGALGDTDTLSALIALITDRRINGIVAQRALQALEERDDRKAIPTLMPLLFQSQISRNIRASIAEALGRLDDETIIAQLVALAVDPALDSLVRGSCAYAFTTHILRTRRRQSEVLHLLADAHINEYVRRQIAEGLAEAVDQGDHSLLEALHGIYEKEGYDDVRFNLAIALGQLGDLSVLPQLRTQLARTKYFSYRHRRATALIVEYTPTPELMQMLIDGSEIAFEVRIALVEAIAKSHITRLIPDLLEVLEYPAIHEELRVSIADTIGALGETREVVEYLLQLWRRLGEPYPWRQDLPNHIYSAMWAVSRRAGVIIVQEGETYRVVERAALRGDASSS